MANNLEILSWILAVLIQMVLLSTSIFINNGYYHSNSALLKGSTILRTWMCWAGHIPTAMDMSRAGRKYNMMGTTCPYGILCVNTNTQKAFKIRTVQSPSLRHEHGCCKSTPAPVMIFCIDVVFQRRTFLWMCSSEAQWQIAEPAV